jgi:hypothetical protein
VGMPMPVQGLESLPTYICEKGFFIKENITTNNKLKVIYIFD